MIVIDDVWWCSFSCARDVVVCIVGDVRCVWCGCDVDVMTTC
jgi:hypothetical protein